MASDENSLYAQGAVTTWAGSISVTAGPAGMRAADIPRWSAARQDDCAAPGVITISDGAREDAVRQLHQALTELQEYFSGIRRAFTVALDPQGTSFYRVAWAEVAHVPYGETPSYAEIAQAIGSSTAVQAVGAANGANPVAPFVPCHRIVGSDGRLTGYGSGLPLKARLLAMESAIPADADHYDAWAATLSAHTGTDTPVLGIRGTSHYCVPGCARSRACWALPQHLFASAAAAATAGYTACPQCAGAR